MLTRHTHGEVTWINASHPTHDEVRHLMEEFGLDEAIATELTSPSIRTRADVRDSYVYLVLHLPALTKRHRVAGTAIELDIVMGKNWIITTRYDSVDPLHQFSKVFEVNHLLEKKDMGTHAGYFFYHMLSELYRTLGNELAYIERRLDDAEERIFKGDEKGMVVELSKLSRDLLNYSQALITHRDILSSLEKPAALLYGYDYIKTVRFLANDYERLWVMIESHRASLRELRETNDSLLTTKQNEIMKVFTILAFVTFPLSLFASLFGMNTENIPIVGNSYDFWIIVGIMSGAAGIFFWYFRHKGWL